MKIRAAIRYSAKPIMIGYAIFFACTALVRFSAVALHISFSEALFLLSFLDMLFFFFAGALTFPRRTDILLQFGVSREKQYTVLWGLCAFAALAGIVNAVLQGGCALAYEATVSYASINPVENSTTWDSVLASTLPYSIETLLKNLAAMFAGNIVGILLYRFLRAGSRLNIILPIALVVLPMSGIGLVMPYSGLSLALTDNIAGPPMQFMDSPLRWTLYFWGQNFFIGSADIFGDAGLFFFIAPLFHTVILASLCCILLRNLPVRRGLDA